MIITLHDDDTVSFQPTLTVVVNKLIDHCEGGDAYWMVPSGDPADTRILDAEGDLLATASTREGAEVLVEILNIVAAGARPLWPSTGDGALCWTDEGGGHTLSADGTLASSDGSFGHHAALGAIYRRMRGLVIENRWLRNKLEQAGGPLLDYRGP